MGKIDFKNIKIKERCLKKIVIVYQFYINAFLESWNGNGVDFFGYPHPPVMGWVLILIKHVVMGLKFFLKPEVGSG